MTVSAPQSRFPNQRVFKDMPVTSWTGGWSTSTVEGALNAHDQGQFMLSAQLAEAVQRDARVSSALNTRAKGVVGLPVTITASTVGDRALAAKAAQAIHQRWHESNWSADLVQVLRWQILMGFGLAELVWTGTAERWDFDLKLWHPQFLWFNWADRSYTLNTAEGPVTVTPGDGKWLLYTPEGPYRAWMTGGVRSIAQPWLGRQHEKRDWMRFCELYGLGILKAKVPSATIEGDKDTFFDSLTVQRGSELVVLCPQGATPQESYDVELLEATATGWQTFESAIGQDNKEIAIALLGQNLTSDVDGGSFAAATVHAAVKQDYIEADARGLALAFLNQALRLWAQFNYGDADLAPTLAWNTKPPEDRKAEADTLVQVSTAVAALAQAAPDVDCRALLEHFGVPLLGRPEATSRVTLARLVTPRGSKRGQDYVEDVAAMARDRAAEAMAPNVRKVLSAIERAGSYDELRPLLAEAFNTLDPTELAKVTEHALVLSQLAGRHALIEDTHAHVEP